MTPLSPAEHAVLHLLANGRSVTGIAMDLGITPDTVARHRRNAFRKLQATDLPGAILTAFQRGILRPDDMVTGPHRWTIRLADAQAKLAAVHRLARGLGPGHPVARRLHAILNPRQETP